MTSGYLTVFLWVAGMLLAAGIAVLLIIKLTSRRFRRSVRTIIFELDTLANRMGNERKRRIAIHSIKEGLGWHRVLVPALVLGWIIDSEVAAVRRRKRATNVPGLYQGLRL